MEIKFYCPRWGAEHLPWEGFLTRVKAAGYAGVEWFPFAEKTDYWQVLLLIEKFGLEFSIVMTVVDEPVDFKDYVQALENQLLSLCAIKSGITSTQFITAQTGREFYSVEQVEICLEICKKVSRKTGISIYQETHRNKWAYAAYKVLPFLQKHDDLLLTLDISHWFCVSESYLYDQQDAVNQAILHARHIHARVGHTEGPQVWDPAMDEYKQALDEHLKVWDRWIQQRLSSKASSSTITPEFGPPPYMVTGNRTGNIFDEQWRMNCWIKNLLQDRYKEL